MKKIRCNCGRMFGKPEALAQHQRDYHAGADVGHEIRASSKPPAGDGDDESFADRAIQAELDEAMGVENFDREWLI